MYLLDTMVLSQLGKNHGEPQVIDWIRTAPAGDLYLCTVTVGEIELGIEKQRTLNPSFSERLSEWLEVTLRAYADRILPLDVSAVRRWGRLAARLGNRNLDLAIAAIALEHGLVVVTRNVTHFAPTGVSTLNPFDGGRP